MSTFRPIDFQPLNFNGLGQIGELLMAARKARGDMELAKENAATQRKFAENTEKRISAQAAREKEQDRIAAEARTHALDVERSQALLPTSPLMRAARAGGAGVGNAIGKPYGISFGEDAAEAPNPLMQAARNAAGTPPKPPAQEMPDLSALPLPPGVGQGLDMIQRSRPQATDEDLLNLATAAVPQGDQALETAIDQAQPTKRLFANVNGQRFDIPEAKTSTGLGQKYDAVYQQILDRTGDEGKAYQAVLVMAEKDAAQESSMARTKALIESREGMADQFRPDVETQDEWLNRRLAQSETNARIGASGRIAAAGAGFKQEGANDRAISLLDRRMENVKRTTSWNKLTQENRTVRSIFANIADGAVPLAHKDAQIQLARFFRQAQPTEGEMHLLYNNLGGTMDKWNQFVARISNGDLSAEQLRQLKESSKVVKHEHEEAVKRTYDAVRASVGPGSGFENMADNVNSYVRGMFHELGEEVPDVYGDVEGGITIGSQAPPARKPKGTKKRTQLDELEAFVDGLGK